MSYILKDEVHYFFMVIYGPLEQEKNWLRKNSGKGGIFHGSLLWTVESSLDGSLILAGFRHNSSIITKNRCVCLVWGDDC